MAMPSALASFERSMTQRQHDAAGRGFDGAVDHGDVAGKETGAGHALARKADGGGRRRIADEELVEVERPVEIVVGRRREAVGGGAAYKRDGLDAGGLDVQESVDVTGAQRSLPEAPGYIGDRNALKTRALNSADTEAVRRGAVVINGVA
jgi:hypothetical protein